MHCSADAAVVVVATVAVVAITGRSRCTTIDGRRRLRRGGHGWGHVEQQRGLVVFRGQYPIVELVLGGVGLGRRLDVHEGDRRADADDQTISVVTAAADATATAAGTASN